MGAVCGLRAFMGPAITAGAANRRVLRLERTPLAWLAEDRTATTVALLAAGELIADKLPFIPSRTQTPSLAIRFLSGAICGAAIASRRNPSERIMSAIVGGTAAVAAAYAGYQYRKHVRLPALAAALLEDTVAVGLGNVIVSSLCS
jgi:uncharacterized membrane protein